MEVDQEVIIKEVTAPVVDKVAQMVEDKKVVKPAEVKEDFLTYNSMEDKHGQLQT